MTIKRPNILGKDSDLCNGIYCAVGWIANQTVGFCSGSIRHIQLHQIQDRLGVTGLHLDDLAALNDDALDSETRICHLEQWLKSHGHSLE